MVLLPATAAPLSEAQQTEFREAVQRVYDRIKGTVGELTSELGLPLPDAASPPLHAHVTAAVEPRRLNATVTVSARPARRGKARIGRHAP